MTIEEQREILKRCQAGWDFLEEERREKVRQMVTPRDLPKLDGWVLPSLKRFPPAPTSGLLEQQRLFMKLHPPRPE